MDERIRFSAASWLPAAGGSLMVVAVLATVGSVGSMFTGGRARLDSCQEMLVRIDGAKEQWSLETGSRDAPTIEDLASSDGRGYLRRFPECPQGGTYIIGAVGVDPVCTSGLPGHSLAERGDSIPFLIDTLPARVSGPGSVSLDRTGSGGVAP